MILDPESAAGALSAEEILDLSPEPTFLVGGDGRVRYANRAAAERYGSGAGRPVEDVLPADVLASAERRGPLLVLRSGGPQDAFSALLSEFSGYLYDIDLAADRAWRSDGLFRVVGYRPEEVADDPEWWWSRLHPDDFRRVHTAVAKGERSDDPIEYRIRHRDGRWIWVQDRARTLRDAQGKAVRMVGLTLDVTARRSAEEQVRGKERRLRAMVDANPIGVLFGDVHGGVADCNRAYLDIIGYSREDLMQGRVDWRAITPPEHLPLDERGIAEAKEKGRCTPYEKEYVRPDGTRVPVLVGFTLFGSEREESAAFILDLRPVREAESLSRAAMDGMAEAIIVFQENGDAVVSNAAFCRLHGLLDDGSDYEDFARDFRCEDLDGRPVPPDEWPALRAMRGENVYGVFLRCFPPNAPPFVGDYSAVRVPAPGGGARVVVTVHDVTARVEAESALRLSESRLRTLTESGPQMVWTTDTRGVPDYASGSWERFFGLTLEEAARTEWRNLMHPEDYDRVNGEWMRAIAAGNPFATEMRARRHDGEYRWLHVATLPVRRPDGEIERWYGTYTDVHDRKIAEDRLRLVLDNVPPFVWTADARGVCDFVSDRWCAYAGVPASRLVGEGWRDFVHPDDREATMRATRDAVDGSHHFEAEFRVRRHDGAYRWFLSRGAETKSPDGSVAGWFGTMTDVHEARTLRDELARSEARARAAVRAVSGWVWTNDPNGEMRGEQPDWAALTGQTRDQYEGYGWAAAVHPDDVLPTVEAWRRAVTARSPFLHEHRVQRADGTWGRYAIRAIPTLDDAGEVVEWVGVHVDVTEQTAARRRRDLLAEIAESARLIGEPALVVAAIARALGEEVGATRCAYADVEPAGRFRIPADWTAPGVVTSAGIYDLALFGPRAEAEMLAGRTLVIRDVVAELAEGEGRETFLAIGCRAIVCVPLVKEGRLVAMMAVHQNGPREWTEEEIGLVEAVADRAWSDIERARVAHLAEEGRERLRALAEASPSFLWVVRDGELEFMSPSWYEYTGMSPEEYGQEGLRRIMPAEDWEEMMANWADAAGEHREFRAEFRLTDVRTGEPRWFLARAVPVTDPVTGVVRWYGATTDIHDQKTEEERLGRMVERRTQELMESNRDLESFSYSVSHDLRSPARAVSSSAMILLEDYGHELSPDARAQLERQAAAARRMGALIDDLLQLSRVGRQQISRAEFDLSALARAVAEEVPVRPGEPDPVFEIEPGLTATGDEGLVRLLLQNLLENGVKFARPGAGARVRVGRSGRGFFVEDDGIGFDPAYARQIFEPFQRLHSDGEIPGTGIGLANVKRIVERHGGTVRATAEPGRGARFEFDLGG